MAFSIVAESTVSESLFVEEPTIVPEDVSPCTLNTSFPANIGSRAPRSTHESAWWTAAAQSEGPYSPRPGSMSVTFCGGIKALERDFGVDVSVLTPGDFSRTFEAKDAAGRTWYCRWIGTPLWTAFRERTEGEVVEFIEGCNDRVQLMLRKSVVIALRRVSWELRDTVDEMRPERQLPRAHRRKLKNHLDSLATFQSDLLYKSLKGHEVRERMRQLNMHVGDTDYEQWLDQYC